MNQSQAQTNKITNQTELDKRREICYKALAESIAKKYDKVNKMDPDSVLTKMAESVANKGRSNVSSQDQWIRNDFNSLNHKVNENQTLLNQWGGIASQHNQEEVKYQQSEQNEHNHIREDVVRLQDHYNQDPKSYNQNFDHMKNEHGRLNHQLDEKNALYRREIDRLRSTQVVRRSVREGDIREVNRLKEVRQSNVRENKLQERVVDEKRYENIVSRHTRRSQANATGDVRYTGELGLREQNANVQTNVVTKDVEVVVERPVIVERIVEVPYEVIVEKPVENFIEKEVVYERVVEKPVERYVEREVEEIIEQEKEVIIEKPVYTERIVENPIVKRIEKQVEVIVEKPVEVIEENHIQVQRRIAKPRRDELKIKEVIVEKPEIVEEVVEKRVERPYTVYKDVEELQYVDRDVIKEVENLIEVEKFEDHEVVEVRQVVDTREEVIVQRVEKPVTKEVIVEEIVERRVQKPVRRTVRKEIEVEVIEEQEQIVEVPTYVDKQVEVIVENPVPREKIIEVEKTVDIIEEIQIPTKKEVIVEKEVEVEQPVYRTVAKYVEKPVEKYVDVYVEKPVTIYVDEEVVKTVVIDKKVPKIVEKEVVIEIPIEREVEKIVEVERIKEVPVYVDKEVQKKVPKIIEKIVEVKVPKYIEVQVEKEKEKIIEQIVEVENPIYIEEDNEEIVNIMDTGKNERLRKSYKSNISEINTLEVQLQQLKMEVESARKVRKSLRTSTRTGATTVIGKDENNRLREELDRLHQAYTESSERTQKEQHLEVVKNNPPRRSVRRSQMPMDVKKSVIQVENDEKKYYMTNEYGQKVEISESEYLRLKNSSTLNTSTFGGQQTTTKYQTSGDHYTSSYNRPSQHQTTTVIRSSNNNGTSYVRTSNNQGTTYLRPSQNQNTSYNRTSQNQGYTTTYQSGKNESYSKTSGQNLYMIDEHGNRVPISREKYEEIQRKSGIYNQ